MQFIGNYNKLQHSERKYRQCMFIKDDGSRCDNWTLKLPDKLNRIYCQNCQTLATKIDEYIWWMLEHKKSITRENQDR